MKLLSLAGRLATLPIAVKIVFLNRSKSYCKLNAPNTKEETNKVSEEI